MADSTETLIGADRRRVSGMFAGHLHERVIIDSVLQGNYGRVIVDSAELPRAALLQLDQHNALAGDPEAEAAEALIGNIHEGLVITASKPWRDRVLQDKGTEVSVHRRTQMCSATLELEQTRRVADNVPAGYEIRRIDRSMVPEALGHLAYSSPEEFLRNGFGFCGFCGDQIVSRARTFIDSNDGIEVAIIVGEKHRGRGLAKATAAALVQHSLELGYDPNWTAINAASVRVAETIGYIRGAEYELLELTGA